MKKNYISSNHTEIYKHNNIFVRMIISFIMNTMFPFKLSNNYLSNLFSEFFVFNFVLLLKLYSREPLLRKSKTFNEAIISTS